MDLNAPLLLYCERLGPGLWAEPLNVVSNAGYFWFAWKLGSQGAAAAPGFAARIRLLALLIALVGAASVVFHCVATRWANILDVAAIALFNLVYLAFFLRVIAGWPRRTAVAAAAGFLLCDRATAALLPPGLLNGSAFYVPALVALAALTAHALRVAPVAGRMMRAAALVFVLALAARTADLGLCPAWPWGTHFVWHLLTAWVLHHLASALRFGVAGTPALRSA